ncbi:MAG: hypothetical protein GYA23_06670 [Methanomicrobiales archaeon]|nr:hypothetical protein [Methanomicrobiales archaeon]
MVAWYSVVANTAGPSGGWMGFKIQFYDMTIINGDTGRPYHAEISRNKDTVFPDLPFPQPLCNHETWQENEYRENRCTSMK